jgi:hypothetical protein
MRIGVVGSPPAAKAVGALCGSGVGASKEDYDGYERLHLRLHQFVAVRS